MMPDESAQLQRQFAKVGYLTIKPGVYRSGKPIVLTGLSDAIIIGHGVTIKAGNGQGTTPDVADTLRLVNCRNITLIGFTFGGNATARGNSGCRPTTPKGPPTMRFLLAMLLLCSSCAATAIQPGTTQAAAVPVSVSVRQYGAIGNGVHDDSDAIQAAIGRAGVVGGIVNFPVGHYMISRPIKLPRTGPIPATAVQLKGEAEYSTFIHGLGSFPPRRGLVEWNAGAGNLWACYGQKISGLTLWCPNGVPGVKAIWHQAAPDALASYVNVQREWLQLDLSNVRIECNNTDHEVLIDLGIGCRFSRWVNVTADPWEGSAPKFDTLLVRTPTTYTGANLLAPDDGVGFVLSHLSGIYPMLMRGGACRTFEGRLFASTFEDSQDCGGRYGTNAIAYHFINSAQARILNIACEPKGSQTLRIDNGQYVTVDGFSGGCPGRKDGQTSIAVNGSRHVRLLNHLAIPGEASFSQFGLSLLMVDKDCVDVVADGFDVTVLGGDTPNGLAAQQIKVDPSAKFCRASGVAVQAWSPDHDAAGNIIPYCQPYAIATP